MRAPHRSPSERAFAVLLRVYPASFRAAYGTDVVELFRDRLREARARGLGAVMWLWSRTLPNMLVNGLLERFAEYRRRPSPGGGDALRWAVRRLVRSPGLSTSVVLTLGVGIGANVAIFSVLRGVVLKPLRYVESDRLVRLWETNADVGVALSGPSPLDFVDWERASPGLESMAAWYLTSGTYRGADWAEEIRSAQVTVDFFRVLGVQPLLGRDFRRAEVVGYGPVMLSHRVWQRRFGGDPDVVGRTVESSGSTYEIVGVMPPDFTFPDESVETWVAWDLASVYADRPESRTWRFLDGIGRLAPGTTIEEAEQGLSAVAAGLAAAYPDMNQGWSATMTSLHEEIVGDSRAALWLSFGAVLFIQLIACANVANLLLARVPERGRELAIHQALGAGRGRLARGLIAEYVILAVGASALGLLIGVTMLELLVAIDAGRIPRLEEVGVDSGVLLFTAGLTALTCILFGLAPVVQALEGSLRSSLGAGIRQSSTVPHRRVREAFVASQVAVALVLLAGAGLFSASLGELRSVDPGIDVSDIATFRVSLDPVDGTAEEIVRYYEGLEARLREVPGVLRVGAAQTLPLNPVGNDFRRPYRRAGSGLESSDAPTVQMRIVTAGYIDAIGMRLVEGGSIPGSSELGEPLVAVVNQALALRLWPAGQAVGEWLEIDFRDGWQPYRVVGVVQDVRHYGVRAQAQPEVFLAHAQVPYLAMSLVVKTAGDARASTEALRAAVLSHVPMQPPHNFVTVAELMSTSIAEERFLSVLLIVFAGIGLALATTGVYGVIAYTVSRRRDEIGVRMALGAHPRRVVMGVFLRALVTAGVGMLIGVAGVAALSSLVDDLLFGVTPADPGTNLLVMVLLLAASGAAAYLPARRAAAVAPVEALRAGQ